MQIRREKDTYTLYKERTVIGTARLAEGAVWVEIDPAWQRRGYGSYLLKELLRESGKEVHMVENCSMDTEKVYHSVDEIPDDAGYFSLIVAKEAK